VAGHGQFLGVEPPQHLLHPFEGGSAGQLLDSAVRSPGDDHRGADGAAPLGDHRGHADAAEHGADGAVGHHFAVEQEAVAAGAPPGRGEAAHDGQPDAGLLGQALEEGIDRERERVGQHEDGPGVGGERVGRREADDPGGLLAQAHGGQPEGLHAPEGAGPQREGGAVLHLTAGAHHRGGRAA
jgi:hypothetical protein